jgi:hypothetical protein
MFDEEGVLDTMECLAVPVGTVQGNNNIRKLIHILEIRLKVGK